MQSLANPAAQRSLESRLLRLTPSDTPRWGSMSVHQMICHMTEAFRAALGEIPLAPRRTRIPRPLMKCAALYIPMQWPHSFPSPPEIAQDQQGTPPIEFLHDHAALLAAFHDFCTRFAAATPAPPILRQAVEKRMAEMGLSPHRPPSPPIRTLNPASRTKTKRPENLSGLSVFPLNPAKYPGSSHPEHYPQ